MQLYLRDIGHPTKDTLFILNYSMMNLPKAQEIRRFMGFLDRLYGNVTATLSEVGEKVDSWMVEK